MHIYSSAYMQYSSLYESLAMYVYTYVLLSHGCSIDGDISCNEDIWFVCVYVCMYIHVPAIVIVSPLSDPFDLSHNLGNVVSVKSECLQECTVCCH